MMYFYEIGYYDYESQPNTVLCHSKKFTPDEFNEMVLNCYVKSSKEAEKVHNEWKDRYPQDNQLEDHYIHLFSPRVDDLYSRATAFMIIDYGFRYLDIVTSFQTETDDIIGDTFKSTGSAQLEMLRRRFNVIEPRDNKINDILNE